MRGLAGTEATVLMEEAVKLSDWEGGVVVMDEIVYDSLAKYFHLLEKTGTASFQDTAKVLILSFYRDFLYEDYEGVITAEECRLISRALDCLLGTTCLIPYPDYLKGKKVHLGTCQNPNP